MREDPMIDRIQGDERSQRGTPRPSGWLGFARVMQLDADGPPAGKARARKMALQYELLCPEMLAHMPGPSSNRHLIDTIASQVDNLSTSTHAWMTPAFYGTSRESTHRGSEAVRVEVGKEVACRAPADHSIEGYAMIRALLVVLQHGPQACAHKQQQVEVAHEAVVPERQYVAGVDLDFHQWVHLAQGCGACFCNAAERRGLGDPMGVGVCMCGHFCKCLCLYVRSHMCLCAPVS